jgi:enoyl-CoA hydratase/carnithine racemase
MDSLTFTALRIEHDPGAPTASLVLDRPERLNALSRVMLAEIASACRWIDDQRELRVVIVRGEGRAFTAGFDVDDFAVQATEMSSRQSADLGRVAAEALTDVRPLTIAAIHGHCVGGGVVLAAACDLRLAAHGTRFSIPELDLGIPLTWGGIPRLVRELGPAITKELVLTCRPFTAEEAAALRFVNRVLPAADLLGAAQTLADELAGKPEFALRTTKQQVNAVTEEIAGTRRNASDADILAAALADPESREAGRRYLAARKR